MRTKRVFDIVAALCGLVLASPIMIVAAILVRTLLGSPVLFQQVRPGYAGVPFTIYKFRSMTDERDENGNLLADEIRLTRFGSWLRKSSIDELPELYNVLKGDMSLVGPRPLLMRYLPFFSEQENLRFTVWPGITGWAQIHGRNESSWNDRLGYDVWYVQHRNFMLDLYILFKTVLIVVQRKGIVVAPSSVLPDLDIERGSTNR
jgi:sugar transferase EpsL